MQRAAHDRADRASRARRQRRVGRRRTPASRSASGGSPSSISRRTAISRCGRPRAATSRCSTARSTTSRSCGASSRRAGSAFAAARTPRSCSPRSSSGASEAAVRRFVGMFAIAVWDAERRELSLVRDRMGKKPLYYVYREPGLVTFGSELKALVAGPSFDRDDRSRARSRRTSATSTCRRRAASSQRVAQDARRAHPDDRRRRARRCRRRGRTGRSREAARDGVADPIRRPTTRRSSELDAAAGRCRPRCGWSPTCRSARFLSGGIDSSIVVALMQESSAPRRSDVHDRLRRRGVRRGAARARASREHSAPSTRSCT